MVMLLKSLYFMLFSLVAIIFFSLEETVAGLIRNGHEHYHPKIIVHGIESYAYHTN